MNIACRLVFVAFLLVSLTLSGCTPSTPIPLATSAEIVIPTDTPAATDTPEPTQTELPTITNTPPPPTKTPIPIRTAAGIVTAGSMNLREGPGTVFQVVTRLAQNAKLVVLGKAPGDEWVKVDTGKFQGWLAVDFIQMTGENAVEFLPRIDYTDGFVIHGKVVDVQGNPVDGVGFAVTYGTGAKPPRTDAVTMLDGSFYAYLPSTATGNWSVSLVSYNCKSRIMDANCKHGGNVDPVTTTITLPTVPDLVFTYR